MPYKNKEEATARRREYYILNKEKINSYNKAWRLDNVTISREMLRKKDIKAREILADSYIKARLKQQGFKTEQITPELIELKRITIKTTRLCRQLKA